MNHDLEVLLKKYPLPLVYHTDNYGVVYAEDNQHRRVPLGDLIALANAHRPEPKEERYYVEQDPYDDRWDVATVGGDWVVATFRGRRHPNARAAAEQECARLNAECKPDPLIISKELRKRIAAACRPDDHTPCGETK